MSGGSFNYLCYQDADTLLQKQQDIQEMADALAKLGYAKDAALETQNLLLTILQFENRIQAMKDRLSGVWQAVEWWHSGDSLEQEVKDELEKYRK